MIKGSTHKKIRKIHRYLGIFLGIQFLFWTISGLYFSWTDIDEIHGDQYKKIPPEAHTFTHLVSPDSLENYPEIKSLTLKEINNTPYYWVNNKYLYNAHTGKIKKAINKTEALSVAQRYIKDNLKIKDVDLITSVDNHHEYRSGALPAYVISYYTGDKLKAYISVNDGSFRTVRHQSWRWFDFLWMTHTMDYQGRDNFNTFVLRAFSLLGLITVLSGFVLWFVSSPRIRKIKKNKFR
jgi:uncharacterized iron-regulated membrane protein